MTGSKGNTAAPVPAGCRYDYRSAPQWNIGSTPTLNVNSSSNASKVMWCVTLFFCCLLFLSVSPTHSFTVLATATATAPANTLDTNTAATSTASTVAATAATSDATTVATTAVQYVENTHQPANDNGRLQHQNEQTITVQNGERANAGPTGATTTTAQRTTTTAQGTAATPAQGTAATPAQGTAAT
eukprot:Lankesteria_metandrocarpae@DN9613_c0_g1_i1.p1